MYDNKRKLLNFIQVSVDLRKGGWGGMGVVDLVTNTVCIERAVCFIGVWEHSVMCWFYPQKGIKKKKRFYYSTFLEWHTHKSQRTSVTHSLSHTNMTGTWLWLPDGFSTLEHGTQWFRMMYTDHSIFSYLSFCVFALLIFFFSFQAHVYGTWEKRSSSHKHKHPF